ncbi:MAG TPA: hypothetical protein ENO30_06630 [Thermodesulfobium narugense]|nr:hypothetical protein [Thermodesulfobium narugense]
MDYSIVAYNENKKIFGNWKNHLDVAHENGYLSIIFKFGHTESSESYIGPYEDVNIFPTKTNDQINTSEASYSVKNQNTIELPHSLYAVVKSNNKYQIIRITGESTGVDGKYAYKSDVIYESNHQVFPFYCSLNKNSNIPTKLIFAELNNDYEWELKLIKDAGPTQKLDLSLIGILPDQFHFAVNKYLIAQRHIMGHALASYSLFNVSPINQHGFKITISNSRTFNLKSHLLALLYITMPDSNKFFCLNELLGGRDLNSDEVFSWTVGAIDDYCSEKYGKIISDANFSREEMKMIEKHNLHKLSLVLLNYLINDRENVRKIHFLVEPGKFDFVIPVSMVAKGDIRADEKLPSKIIEFLKFKIDQIKAQEKSVDQSQDRFTGLSLSK